MWTQIRMAAIATAFVAGTAAVDYGQGSSTQDPGRMAPGNLTTDRLGPSAGSPVTGGASRSSGRTAPGATGSGSTTGGYGSSNTARPGAAANPPSRSGSP